MTPKSPFSQALHFNVPYRWLCVGFSSLLVGTLVLLLAWRPEGYASIQSLIPTPAGANDNCLRADASEYAEAFADFAAVPVHLGKTLEFGCSSTSITDTLLSLQQRTVDSVTIAVAPCDGTCPRAQLATNTLVPEDNFFNSTAEYRISAVEYADVDSLSGFDTVTGVLSLDRTDNAYRVLWSMYQALKPGGVLVLYDRVYVGNLAFLDRMRKGVGLATPNPATTVTPAIMSRFLAHFDIVFQHDTLQYSDSQGRVYTDVAVVARKPSGGKLLPLHPPTLSLSQIGTEMAADMAANQQQSNSGYSSENGVVAGDMAPQTAQTIRQQAQQQLRGKNKKNQKTQSTTTTTAVENNVSKKQENTVNEKEQEGLLIENTVRTTGSASSRYFLIWTTGKETFDKLRYTVLDRLFMTVPHAEVFVFANLLPDDMFDSYNIQNKTVHLVRYDQVGLFNGTPLAKWAANLDEWKKGKYLYSHFTDAFRLCVLWKYGGIYIDFDVLVLRDLGGLRNSYGVEDAWGVKELKPLSARITPSFSSAVMNFAIANFDQGSPFLNYLMLQFHKVYDPSVWSTVGPDLVTLGMQDWRRFHPDLVMLRERAVGYPDIDTPARRFEATITIWTDPAVFYPVGWKSAVKSTTKDSYDANVMQAIRERAFTFHVYTQMFKFEKRAFSYEPGSLIDYVLKENYVAPLD